MVRATIVLFFLLISSNAFGDDRYPPYLPEWIWKDQEQFAALMDEGAGAAFEARMAEARSFYEADRAWEGWALEQEAVRELHGQFSVRDLVRYGEVVESGARSIAVVLDPQFPEDMRPVLLTAVERYLELATDESVVDAAYRDASEEVQLIPAPDDDAFELYARHVVKPTSPSAFTRQLSHALDGGPVEPAIIISSYVGGTANVWWGGGIYDNYANPDLWLTRAYPSGFFYIRLNLDRMATGEARRDDPNFWASKIAHETAHNLGYWHPGYTDPVQRDEVAPAGERPFIYAYELALLAAAEKRHP